MWFLFYFPVSNNMLYGFPSNIIFSWRNITINQHSTIGLYDYHPFSMFRTHQMQVTCFRPWFTIIYVYMYPYIDVLPINVPCFKIACVVPYFLETIHLETQVLQILNKGDCRHTRWIYGRSSLGVGVGWCGLNIMMPSYQYRGSYYKDKRVPRPPYLYNETNPYKDGLYIETAPCFPDAAHLGLWHR